MVGTFVAEGVRNARKHADPPVAVGAAADAGVLRIENDGLRPSDHDGGRAAPLGTGFRPVGWLSISNTVGEVAAHPHIASSGSQLSPILDGLTGRRIVVVDDQEIVRTGRARYVPGRTGLARCFGAAGHAGRQSWLGVTIRTSR